MFWGQKPDITGPVGQKFVSGHSPDTLMGGALTCTSLLPWTDSYGNFFVVYRHPRPRECCRAYSLSLSLHALSAYTLTLSIVVAHYMSFHSLYAMQRLTRAAPDRHTQSNLATPALLSPGPSSELFACVA